jgi:hypothetical protein
MKVLRILALASLFALGLGLSAQTQQPMTDQSTSTTTTMTTTQQTVDTPAGQTTINQETIYTTPLTDQELPSGTVNGEVDNNHVDYDQNPFWSPKDWNYIEAESNGGG